MRTEIIAGLHQNTPQWVEFRKAHFGASDAAAACNAGKFYPRNRDELVESIRTGDRKVFKRAVNHGKKMEAQAIQVAEVRFGQTMEPVVCRRIVDGLPLIASLDGMNLDGDTVWEIKCPYSAKSETLKDIRAGRIPRHYQYQLEQQLLVSGAALAEFCVFDGEQMLTLTYAANPAMREAIIHGWKIVHETLRGINAGKAAAEGNRDPDYLEAAAEYIEAERLFRAADDRKSSARERLLELAGNAPTFGGGVRISASSRKGTIDYDKVFDSLGVGPEILEGFRKPGFTVQTITIIEEKNK